jgi:hypothetical protein
LILQAHGQWAKATIRAYFRTGTKLALSFSA